MEILSTPTEDWQAEMTCPRCGTVMSVDQGDVELAGFKTSGLHFAGTAVIEDFFVVTCPTDRVDIQIDDDDLPLVLRDRLRRELEALRRERGY